MQETVFKARPLEAHSLMQRLFRQFPSENAVIELNNLLATRDLLTIQEAELLAIEQKYGLKLASAYAWNLQEFYAVLWNAFLKSGGSGYVSLQQLEHIAALFLLKSEMIRMLENRIGAVWYRQKAAELTAKRRLTPDDQAVLRALKEKLRLDNQSADEILGEEQLKVINTYIKPVAARNRCKPEQLLEFETMIASFGIAAAQVRDLRLKLETLAHYWNLEHLPLVSVQPSITIQKSEKCYLQIRNVSWLETRSVRRGVQEWAQVNYGTLCLTEKRLVFEGNAKNSVIPYDRIVAVANQKDGFMIRKDKGKDPVLSFTADKETFNIIFSRLSGRKM